MRDCKRPALVEAMDEALGVEYDVVLEPSHLHGGGTRASNTAGPLAEATAA